MQWRGKGRAQRAEDTYILAGKERPRSYLLVTEEEGSATLTITAGDQTATTKHANPAAAKKVAEKCHDECSILDQV